MAGVARPPIDEVALAAELGTVTANQRAYLDAFDRFLRASGPAKLLARHEMREHLSGMFADAGIEQPVSKPRAFRGRHGPRHDTGR